MLESCFSSGMEVELLIGFAGTIAAIATSTATLAYWLGRKFARMETRVNLIAKSVKEITEAVRNQIEFFAEFLGFKKVLEARDVSFVKSEPLRLSAKPLTNPLTKEEAWRLRELIEKEKLTLEEADELREIARKLVREHGDAVPEAWKLLIYASIMRGLALSELEEGKR
jgi:hypothetical protein